jgi:hypothetical protein
MNKFEDIYARFILDVAKEHGSFGKFIANWPSETLIELFAYLKKHGSRCGTRPAAVSAFSLYELNL